MRIISIVILIFCTNNLKASLSARIEAALQQTAFLKEQVICEKDCLWMDSITC
jgi:hypothetical protein